MNAPPSNREFARGLGTVALFVALAILTGLVVVTVVLCFFWLVVGWGGLIRAFVHRGLAGMDHDTRCFLAGAVFVGVLAWLSRNHGFSSTEVKLLRRELGRGRE